MVSNKYGDINREREGEIEKCFIRWHKYQLLIMFIFLVLQCVQFINEERIIISET